MKYDIVIDMSIKTTQSVTPQTTRHEVELSPKEKTLLLEAFAKYIAYARRRNRWNIATTCDVVRDIKNLAIKLGVEVHE